MSTPTKRRMGPAVSGIVEVGEYASGVESGIRPLSAGAPLEAGVDFPTDQEDFERMFGSEQGCCAGLEALRFPTGFQCPQCDETAPPWRRGALLACTTCHCPVRLTEGTLFHGSGAPLKRWYQALWEMSHPAQIGSSETLQQHLGVRREGVVEERLAALRQCMAGVDVDILVGDTRLTVTKLAASRAMAERMTLPPAIALAVGETSHGVTEIRLGVLEQGDAAEVRSFCERNVALGSAIYTSRWPGFSKLKEAGYQHVAQLAAKKVTGEFNCRTLLNELTTWLAKADGLETENLQGHFDEFCFRFNRRADERGLIFHQLLRTTASLSDEPLSIPAPIDLPADLVMAQVG